MGAYLNKVIHVPESMLQPAACIQRHMASADEEDESTGSLKKWAWLAVGLCAAATGFLVWGPKRVKPVQDLAQRMEEAWEEHDEDDDLEEALERAQGSGPRAQSTKSTVPEP